MKWKTQRGWFLLLLTLATRPVIAAPSLQMEVQPDWEGWMRPDAATGIGIRLIAQQAGPVELSLPGQQPAIRLNVQLEAKRPHSLWLPVYPQTDKPLRVKARFGGEPPVQQDLWFQVRPSASLVVAVMANDIDEQALPVHKDLLVVRPGIDSLPRSSAAYAVVDALVLDHSVPAQLDNLQRQSLRAYVQDCGRLLLVGSSSPWLDALRDEAGCQGRFIAYLEPARHVPERLQHLLDTKPPALPAAGNLRALLAEQPSTTPWLPLTAFVLFYFVGLLLLARDLRKPGWLLLPPLAASLLSLLVWSKPSAERHLVSWAEMQSGDAAARFHALLQVQGTGSGTSITTLPPELGIPRVLSGSFPVEFRQDSQAPDDGRLAVDTHLLSRHEFLLHGTAPLPPALQLVPTAQGPLLSNRGTVPTQAGILGWRGERYAVPALRPGERWRPPEQSSPWNVSSGSERLLRSCTTMDQAAVLLPFRPAVTQGIGPDLKESGWLLIRS